jgi:hypothetical protein
VDIEVPQQVEAPAPLTLADAGAQTVTAYQDALVAYDAVRQHDMSRFPGLQYGLLSNLGYQVALAYKQCLACGIDPACHAYARIQRESRA